MQRVTGNSTTSKYRKHPVGQSKPSGLVLNEKGLKQFRELAYQNRNVEFLYLRENEFESFEPYITLPSLKVLDLSINSLKGAVDFLGSTPSLRHLYLTGNRISTLEGINGLQFLETLCLSDNDIDSFEGLDNLPNLRVLSLTHNNIKSFIAYPFLPSLHTLNLQNNPIADAASYRRMAIAASPGTLAKLDTVDVTAEERQAVEFYRGKVVYCIAEGMVVEGEQVEEQAEKYLLELQRTTFANKPLKLHTIALQPLDENQSAILEGRPVRLHVCLQDTRDLAERTANMYGCEHLFPVAFRVLGNSEEVFTVGSMNRWSDPIPLERCEADKDSGVLFHTTLYLPAGRHEYRYIVNGENKIDNNQTAVNNPKHGLCNQHDVLSLKGDENDKVMLVRWMRGTDSNGFELIPGEVGLEYTPTARDVGRCLRAELLVYEKQEFSFLYFDISSPVAPGQPTCSKLDIIGTPGEGELLMVDAVYQGGVEGHSILQWFTVGAEEDDCVLIDVEDPWSGITCTLRDVGRRVKVEYTPIRVDGEAGDKSVRMTAAIAAGIPTCRAMKLEGSLVEGEPLTVITEYSGGYEGQSQFQWYRVDDRAGSVLPLAGQTASTYSLTLEDVDRRVAVDYTPVSREGIRGETSRCTLSQAIKAGQPRIHRMSLNITELAEQHAVGVHLQYFGGRQGRHIIQWTATDAAGKVSKIGRGGPTLTLTRNEIGKAITVEVTPVRDDGVTGELARMTTGEVVQPAPPSLIALRVAAKTPIHVGDTLEAVADYIGGEQGESLITWSRETPGAAATAAESERYVVVARQTRKYVVEAEDAGKIVKLSYVPVRADGARGQERVRMVEVAVASPPAAAADAAAPPPA